MENKKVAIILSAYNGELYIKDQIDSLINQTYKNFDIIVRDDGSKDSTVKIVEGYVANNNNIELIKGENIGYVKSFFELLKYAKNYDYYAFCDQDDIWMEDKIERTVCSLSKLDETKPNLFFSNTDYYDMELNFIANGEKNKYYNFRNSIVECVTQGMAMCINKKARDMVVENIPENCVSHDCWVYMLCSAFGEMMYDEKSLVKYRRHSKSVTAEGKNFIQMQIWRIKKVFKNDMIKNIKKQIIEFNSIYNNKLSDENRKVIELFTNTKYSFIKAIKKTFYTKKFRRKLSDEILIRIIFLFGIM